MNESNSDRPGVIAPPPLIFVAFFAAGWFLRRLVPEYQSIGAAYALLVPGVLLLVWGFATMARAKTNIDPYKPATTIVATGPFRFTRNPLYLAMNLLYAAAAFRTGAAMALLFQPLANVVLNFGVIQREERYLEAKFGEVYRVYRAKVRRWL